MYRCWSCFSLWPCSVSLRSNRDVPVLKLFLPLVTLCLSPFKQRHTCAEAVSPSGHTLSLSVQTETFPCWSCFSLWPRSVSLCSNRDLPMLKLFLPLTMLCLSPFKQRLTHAEAVSPSGHALSLSVQTETYPCWSCFSLWPQRLTHVWSWFSLWPCFVSFQQGLTHAEAVSPSGHALPISVQRETYIPCWSCFSLWPHFVSLCSNRDVPVLKLFLPLAMFCLSLFKQRRTPVEAVSPSGHTLSLSVQTETHLCWSCFSLWPHFVSLCSNRDFPMLKLFLPLATLCLSRSNRDLPMLKLFLPLTMLCLSPFKQRLTHAEAVSPSGHALSLSVQTGTYPCWSCFSFWPRFAYLRSNRDLPMLKLVLPLAMLCFFPFKCRLTCTEAVSPSGHTLSLSVQVQTYLCWSSFSLWPRFVSLHSNRDLPVLKLFLPLATLCLSRFK